jgi:hypothetical protein
MYAVDLAAGTLGNQRLPLRSEGLIFERCRLNIFRAINTMYTMFRKRRAS